MSVIKIPSDMEANTQHQTNNYGTLEVVEYINKSSVYVRFIDTGYTTITRSNNVRNGRVKDKLKPCSCDIGYIGDGKYSAKVNGRNTIQYDVWRNMLKRCYDPKTQEKNPSYIGCSVCSEWHNFQNFAEWYCENYPTDGKSYHIDKDIKIKGNKVYSPEACTLVTQDENTVAARAKAYIFLTPKEGRQVFVHNLSEFCRKVGLNQSSMSAVFLGKQAQHKGWRKV